jgi:hypothetical protein
MESCFGTLKTELVHQACCKTGMPPGTTCSLTSKDITIVSGFIPPSGISPQNRQSAKPLNPVSTKSREGHFSNCREKSQRGIHLMAASLGSGSILSRTRAALAPAKPVLRILGRIDSASPKMFAVG